MLSELGIILALVLVNGLLSGAEIAVVTLRKTRLQHLVDSGKGSAKAVAQLRSQPERFLATVQVGITVVGAAAAAYGGDTVSGRLAPMIERVPSAVISSWADEIAFVAVVVLISYVSLILGELVPKSLALRAAESYALLLGRPLLGLSQLARPVVWFLTLSSNVVLRIFGDKTSFTEARMSPDELKAMLEEAGEGGSLDRRASEIATRAIELIDITAADVMVPRNAFVSIAKTAPIDELKAVVAQTGHSRVLVWDRGADDIVGYVSVRDFFTKSPHKVAEAVRPVLVLPETMKAIDVLGELRTRQTHIAIVVDEHGVIDGMLTREDLVEELVGEMLSEHRKSSSSTPSAASSSKTAGGDTIIAGLASVRDVNRVLGLALPEGDWTTVSGLVVAKLGRIPAPGDVVDLGDVELTIIDASPRRVRSVKARAKPKSEASGEAGAAGSPTASTAE